MFRVTTNIRLKCLVVLGSARTGLIYHQKPGGDTAGAGLTQPGQTEQGI